MVLQFVVKIFTARGEFESERSSRHLGFFVTDKRRQCSCKTHTTPDAHIRIALPNISHANLSWSIFTQQSGSLDGSPLKAHNAFLSEKLPSLYDFLVILYIKP